MELTSKNQFFHPIYTVTLANGDTAYIRGVAGPERVAFFAACRALPDDAPVLHGMALWVAATVSDKGGNLIFTADDAVELATKGHDKLIIELYDVSSDLNKIGREAVEDAKKN